MKSKFLAKFLKSHGYQIGDIKEPQTTSVGFVEIKTGERIDLWITVGFHFYGVCYNHISGGTNLPAIQSSSAMAFNCLLDNLKDAIRHIETEKTIAEENGGELPVGWRY